MKTNHYTQKPAAVTVETFRGRVRLLIAVNPRELPRDPETGSEGWEADTHSFWVPEGELNLDAVVTNPAAYLHYIPQSTRQEAKDQAQAMLDALRNGSPIVPVPSYREGAAVCNRAGDKINLLAGLAMGGLPCYELACGEVVSLTVDDLKAIAVDVATAETLMQQAKQQCWATIEQAGEAEEIEAALAAFAAVLAEYEAR